MRNGKHLRITTPDAAVTSGWSPRTTNKIVGLRGPGCRNCSRPKCVGLNGHAVVRTGVRQAYADTAGNIEITGHYKQSARVDMRFHLKALTREETAAYIARLWQRSKRRVRSLPMRRRVINEYCEVFPDR